MESIILTELKDVQRQISNLNNELFRLEHKRYEEICNILRPLVGLCLKGTEPGSSVNNYYKIIDVPPCKTLLTGYSYNVHQIPCIKVDLFKNTIETTTLFTRSAYSDNVLEYIKSEYEIITPEEFADAVLSVASS